MARSLVETLAAGTRNLGFSDRPVANIHLHIFGEDTTGLGKDCTACVTLALLCMFVDRLAPATERSTDQTSRIHAIVLSSHD